MSTQKYTNKIEKKYKECFDNVFCLEVSEYLFDPSTALKNINLFLKKGGVLYISFHTLYGLHKPKGEDCLRYTKYGIEKLLKETGFEIEEIIPRKLQFESQMLLKNFYLKEKMRVDFEDKNLYDSGYLVKAKKI